MTDTTPVRYTPAADRLAQAPIADAKDRDEARREDLLYDSVEHAVRKLNRLKVELASMAANRTAREIFPVAKFALAAEVEYELWSQVLAHSGPSMLEPLQALAVVIKEAQARALDDLEDNTEDLTNARMMARWARRADLS